MTNTIEFRRWNGRRKYVFCFWEDGELKIFKDAGVAERWAERQGFKAVFVEEEPAHWCRRFRHADGFQDSTDYIQVEDSGPSYIVNKNGFAKATWNYDLEQCLRFVESGDWIELEF